MKTHNHHERGIALVLALFLMAALSVLGASLMFLSQTETFASMNYRMMSQARYAAEAGVQRTANFLVDPLQYTVPSATGVDLLSRYDRTKSPVVCLSGCANSDPNNPNHYVILSASPSMQTNYPLAAVGTTFAAVAAGTIHTAPGTNQDVALTYASYATLISMQQFNGYGGTQSVVQTWEITVDGSLTNMPKAVVEVTARVETPKVPANGFGAFATDDQCDAIHFNGNVQTDSYDSSVGPPDPTAPGTSWEATGGDIGSNGNIYAGGSVDVGGNIYTPMKGVGACTAGAVTGLSGMTNGQPIALPGALVFPPPVFLIAPPTTTKILDATALASPVATCTALGLIEGTNCSVSGSTLTVDGHGLPLVMPNVYVESGITLSFVGSNVPGQTIDINSINGAAGANVETNINNAGGVDQSVVLRIAGKKSDGTWMMGTNATTDPSPFDLSDISWKQNATAKSYDASSLQIVYGGPAEISMKGGNSQSAATIYAPNSIFHMKGTQDFYGSILAKKVDNTGNPKIHYDRRLQRDFDMAGRPMMGTFSWKKS